MKLICCIILFTVALNSSAQTKTSQEEYNYVSVGYANHLQDGSDFKKGYDLKDLNKFNWQWQDFMRTVSFKGFYKSGSSKPVAIMLVYTVPSGSSYFCIPAPASDISLWNAYDSAIENFFKGKNGFNPQTTSLLKSMSRMISDLLID